ncbi:MAG: agmatinase family protein [Flavobacteriales bacterium]|nr:agmatinase family protein [Flavobacteriales bacterium]
MNNIDPNGPAVGEGIFGFPYSIEEAQVILIMVPWEGTVSYQTGTAMGPERILEASKQVDLFDVHTKYSEPWRIGLAADCKLFGSKDRFAAIREQTLTYTEKLQDSEQTKISALNEMIAHVHDDVYRMSSKYLQQGKIVGLVGGEHGCAYGLIKSLSDTNRDFGILQIDAHFDLRNAYEGIEHSHASIMFNALQLANVKTLTSVGIRDFCQEELEYLKKSTKQIKPFYDHEISAKLFQGISWDSIVDEIIESLPRTIYISFDIDGLEPSLCPNTGTPVPGGLQFNQAIYLIQKIVQNGNKIIGFDVSEVSGLSDWDANVGARIIYKLVNLTAESNQLNLL